MTDLAHFKVEGALDVPETAQRDSWGVNIEQMIWGHRLINDQSPWLLLLETIAIMAARASDKNTGSIFLPSSGKHEKFSYDVPMRADLRGLLFQDHVLDRIAADGDTLSDEAKWEKWRGKRSPAEVAHLRERFDKFSSFHDAVDLLRAAVVEPERGRRATSRHLIPGGTDMLTADYGISKKTGKVTSDRKFFARGGEIVFLMLNRSSLAERVEELVRRRLLVDTGRWNRVARLLQKPTEPTEEVDAIQYRVGYLPLPHHFVYDRLAEDWVAILSLEQLPDDQLAEPLMRVTGLHVARYIVERSAEVLGRRQDQPMPVDMAMTSAGGLRRVSRERFQLHRELSRLAISKTVDDFAASGPWQQAGAAGDPTARRKQLLSEVLSFKVDQKTTDPARMIEELREEALAKHANHLGQMLGVQAERIGLAVSRVGQGRWYAANNGFLEALVLANVTVPVELERYLETIWARYRLVIGPAIGQRELGTDAPFEQLRANQRVFEERLRMLGFLERLSDDCAFVRNPYHQADGK
jgi:hypothetical protein